MGKYGRGMMKHNGHKQKQIRTKEGKGSACKGNRARKGNTYKQKETHTNTETNATRRRPLYGSECRKMTSLSTTVRTTDNAKHYQMFTRFFYQQC